MQTNPISFTITNDSSGQSGTFHYTEGQNVVSFYWEFLGGEYFMSAQWYHKADWDASLPWAQGRKKEIMHSIGEHVLKNSGPGATAIYNYSENLIYFGIVKN